MGLLTRRSRAALAFAVALTLLFCFSSQGVADNEPVTCGSTIKLSHVKSKHVLHSHEVSYSRGSQQQSVTAFPTSDDGNSYWVIHGTPDMPCPSGQTIAKKSAIRLQHATTRKWLHSHKFQSPLTSQQEVSAFGSDDSTDGGDVWIISWGTTGKLWKQDTKVKLQHRDTSMYLASYEQARFGQPIHGQLEVCAVARADANSDWQTAEGVFMPAENAGTDQHADGNYLLPKSVSWISKTFSIRNVMHQIQLLSSRPTVVSNESLLALHSQHSPSNYNASNLKMVAERLSTRMSCIRHIKGKDSNQSQGEDTKQARWLHISC